MLKNKKKMLWEDRAQLSIAWRGIEIFTLSQKILFYKVAVYVKGRNESRQSSMSYCWEHSYGLHLECLWSKQRPESSSFLQDSISSQGQRVQPGADCKGNKLAFPQIRQLYLYHITEDCCYNCRLKS